MMVKKCVLIAVSLILVFGTVLSGFAKEAQVPERPKNVKLTIVGFTVGTSMHYRAELVAEALRKEYPDWSVRAVSTLKGAVDVIGHRRKKSAQFFISLMPWPLEVEAFGPIFKRRGLDYEKLFTWSGVLPLARKYIHSIVQEKTGLTSLKDMVDKKYKIKVGMSRPSHEGVFNRLIAFYGATLKDLESLGGKFPSVSFGGPAGPESLRTGKIDMGFAWTGIPNPTFVKAAADLNLRLLPIAPEAELLKTAEKAGFYRATIPANAYSFNKENVTTIAQTEWLGHIPGTVSKNVIY